MDPLPLDCGCGALYRESLDDVNCPDGGPLCVCCGGSWLPWVAGGTACGRICIWDACSPSGLASGGPRTSDIVPMERP